MKETSAHFSFRKNNENPIGMIKINKWKILWYIMLIIPFFAIIFILGRYFGIHSDCVYYPPTAFGNTNPEEDSFSSMQKYWIFKDKLGTFYAEKHDHVIIQIFRILLSVVIGCCSAYGIFSLYVFVYNKSKD